MVARGIEWRTEEAAILWRLLAPAVNAQDLGAHLLLIFGGEFHHNLWLANSGWSPWRRGPKSLVYHRNRAVMTAQHVFKPSAGDYGFEAFPLVVNA